MTDKPIQDVLRAHRSNLSGVTSGMLEVAAGYIDRLEREARGNISEIGLRDLAAAQDDARAVRITCDELRKALAVRLTPTDTRGSI